MNWKGYERKLSWPNLRKYPGIFLEGLMKTMKNLSQDSRSLSWNLNLGPPKCGEGVQRLDEIILSIVYWKRSVSENYTIFKCEHWIF
jgi:hypothetical protein